MLTVISTFSDRAAAQHAADRLVESGFAGKGVHLHQKGTAPRNAVGVTVDEVATGGMVSSMLGLLDDLFNARKSPQDADSYVDVVQQQGVGVTVDVSSDTEAMRAEELLRGLGAMKVSRWRPGSNEAASATES